jgi:hypothetical protein
VAATGVTVTATVNNVAGVDAPTFAICASASNNVCTISDLPADQAQELLVGSAVESDAAAGAEITMTATVAAPGATSVKADATVAVASPSSSSSSSSSSFSSDDDSALGDIPDLPNFDLPGVGSSAPGQGDDTYTSPTSLSPLFPAVSPGHHKNQKATTDAAIVPFNSRLIDGQLAGLVVLASAVAIAVVRLSLRSRPHDGTAAHKGQNATPSA